MKTGWTTKKLGEVCKLIGGGTPSIYVAEYYDGKIPWATVRDMNCRVIRKTERTITKEGLANSASNVIPAGNVVISTHVGLGKVCFVERDTAINQDLKGVIPKDDNLDRTFLYYWFLSIADFLIANGTGSTVKGVKLEFVTNLEMPLPPLKEQQRIVAKIDAAFEKIDKLTANAEKNLANARELFQSALDEAFKALKDEKVRLGDVCDVLAGYPFKGDAFSATGIRICGGLIITPKEIKWNECKYWETSKGYEDFLLAADDIVMALDRPWITEGFKIGMIQKSDLPCLLIQRTARLRAKKIVAKYLLYLLRHPSFKEYCTFSGTTVPHISHKDIERYMIPYPPLAVQKQLAAHLDSLSQNLDKLQQNYIHLIADCAEMRQAILQEAFEGRI